MDELKLNRILANSPGYLLSTTSRLLRERQIEVLKPLGLSHNHYVVLRLLKTGVSLAQGSIGSRYGIDPATMVSVIDNLENRRLVSRERDPSDRRKYFISMTPRGNKVIAHAVRVIKKEQQAYLSVLDQNEWETMRLLLCKLAGLPDEESPDMNLTDIADD